MPHDLRSKEEQRHADKEIFFKMLPNDKVNEVKKCRYNYNLDKEELHIM